MFNHNFGKRESRKFIDLLLDSTNKWTNIDAGKNIRVGDFGTIDPSTGDFLIDGNLYDLTETRDIMSKYPVQSTPKVQIEKYSSDAVKELGFSPKVSAGFQPVADISFEASWEFSRDRGALLVLTSAHTEYIRGFPTAAFIANPQITALLKKKVICTDVTSCPAFCLYLSNSKTHAFKISFEASVPIAAAVPGVTAGGGLGIIKQGANPEPVFHPLFSLKAIRWEGLGSVVRGEKPTELEDESIMDDVQKPWKDLDNEGEQIWVPVDSGAPL
ncbi:hypothetical protein BT96DRAFT_919513, partial [Gymnopus androsaceus JB14]